MKYIEVISLIKNIEVKFVSGEYVSFKILDINRYNKKSFIKVNGADIFVGLFFIYDTLVVNRKVDYTYNSIISIDEEGNNIKHNSFEEFIDYLKALPEVEEVNQL